MSSTPYPTPNFTSNNVFYRMSEEEFESHMTGLTLILPRNIDSTAQQVSVRRTVGSAWWSPGDSLLYMDREDEESWNSERYPILTMLLAT